MRLGDEREDAAGELPGHGEHPGAVWQACRHEADQLRDGRADRHLLRRNPDQARPRLARGHHVGVEGVRTVRPRAPAADTLHDTVGNEEGWSADAGRFQISGPTVEGLSQRRSHPPAITSPITPPKLPYI